MKHSHILFHEALLINKQWNALILLSFSCLWTQIWHESLPFISNKGFSTFFTMWKIDVIFFIVNDLQLYFEMLYLFICLLLLFCPAPVYDLSRVKRLLISMSVCSDISFHMNLTFTAALLSFTCVTSGKYPQTQCVFQWHPMSVNTGSSVYFLSFDPQY